MKKIAKKFGLSLATLACVACAGVGVSLSSSKSATKADAAVAASDYWVASTGIRLVNDANGCGIRFNTNVTTAVYETIVESGTLIIPEVRCDGELTLDDLNNADERTCPVQVVTKNADGKDLWYTHEYTDPETGATETVKRSTVYLYELPESMYGARMVAVSYVKTSEGTTYTEIPSATSMSDVASKIGEDSKYYAQAQPYIVGNVTVTYNMPDGSTQTETVAYGSQLSGPKYNTDTYVLTGLTDNYGQSINLASYEATLPVTIDVELSKSNIVAEQLIKDGYGTDSELRAFVNGSTATAVTEGIPAGYSSVLQLDWYQNSTSLWKAGGNPLYRTLYSQADISGYEKVAFGLKLVTSGDAEIEFADGTSVNNAWLFFELVQTGTNVWTLKVTDENGETVYTKADYTRFASGLTDVDSVASLVFPSTWDSATSTSKKVAVMNPCSSADMTASIYMTELRGYNNIPAFDPAIDADATILWNHVWNNYYFTGGDGAEGAYAEDVEAPVGFNYVNYYSWTSTTSNDFPVTGHLNGSDISAYSDLWFAMKVVNGTDIYVQGVGNYTGGDWLYVHMTQAEDGTWTKDFYSVDGFSGTQTGLTDTTLAALMQWKSGVNRGSYPRHEKGSGVTTTAYFTDVLAIKKDGSAITAPTTPDYAIDSTKFDPEISADAEVVRSYIWRDDLYANQGTNTLTLNSEDAPVGYKNVLKHQWGSNLTAEYTYCFDATVDVTLYSDLYFAMKLENGSHIYVKDAGSAGHYYGTDWLYAHYSQNSDGSWTMTVKSPDGYTATRTTTFTATTLQGLTSGILYGCRTDTSVTTCSYLTEVYGVRKGDASGERVIWSAVDAAIPTEDPIGIPAGFTAAYKYENFTMDQFAAMDLTNTIYQKLSFGMLADKDFYFKDGYKYTVSDETEARPTTTIMSKTTNRGQMYLVTLEKNDDGSWHVTINAKRWSAAPESGGSSNQTEELFETDVTGNSIETIMNTFLTATSGMTLYCTEVRGTHTCASTIKSLGNGQLQEVCSICGKGLADPVDYEHGIPAEAGQVLDQVWREDNYALSSSTKEPVPVGFNNIVEFNWLDNPNNWQEGNTDMGLTCIPTDDLSGYRDVYFGMKFVGGTGVYIRGAAKYTGGDWLYAHYSQNLADGTWSLSVKSPDGYVAENVQTGIVGNNLQTFMTYSGTNGNNGTAFYPTKTADSTTAIVYFTDLLGVIGCDHNADRTYEANGDGTHKEICVACNTVLNASVECAGGMPTCTAAAVCSSCNTAYGTALGHKDVVWSWGVGKCGYCGDTQVTAEIVASSAVIVNSSNTNLTDSDNAAGITAPEGFSTVTNLYSASGNTWSNKILTPGEFAKTNLNGYSEVWFEIKIENGHFTQTAPSWTDIDSDTTTPWVGFHLIKEAENTWTIEIYKDRVLWGTQTAQTGDTIGNIFNTSTDGGRIVLYQKTDGTDSIADVNIYATEVRGVFDNGVASYATNVWDHIWNTYYFEGGAGANGSTWSSELAPAGFSKVTEYTWTAANFNNQTGRFNASDISGYSDIWFAMKSPDTTNAPIYVQGASSYAGGDWLYVHYSQNSDGTWNKDFRSADGYYNSTAQVNLSGTKITDMISWTSGVNTGTYPTGSASVETTAYITNVIGVKKCDGTNHTEDIAVSNGDDTHDITCRCGAVVADDVACSGGTATCTRLADCDVCGAEYGEYLAHTHAKYVSNDDGTHKSVCACGATIESVACSGGTATCTTQATCSDCGSAYGELADHKGGTVTCTQQAICEVCGTAYGEVTEHTGGEATCTAQAICEVCGTPYGSKLNHEVVCEEGSYVGTCENCGETALNTGIPDYATQVWAHIWNSYYFTGGGQAEGAYYTGTDVEVPDGFSKLSYYTWTSTTSNDFPITGHLNNTTTISNYSDLFFAMKVVNGMDIYVQGADLYTGGNWLYVHMYQADDGTWSKDFYAIDGYTAIGKQTALTDTNLAALMQWKSGVNRGSYPRLDMTAGQTATAYFTDVLGVLKCSGTHTEDIFTSNGDGTHSVSCRCGTVITARVTCSGGEATCTEAAICSVCGADYSPALGHSGSWTDTNEYYCNRCDTSFGQVVTSLDKQTSALATNASAANFKANEARALTLDLSTATALPISAATVELGGNTYTATIADGNVLSINVLPNAVFGNYEATVTATIEGKSFTISAPVLVVTNMVTTAQGMLDMRTVLRGADLTTADEFSAIGGKGGETTMNGDGYYMLGANIEMTQSKAYVFGTSYVPFVGTFDGNGYILNNYRQNNWFGSNRQDNYLNPTQVANGTSINSGIYGTYLEGSLFGVLDGTVKNVAFTNLQQAIFTNIVHSGSGRLVDVYIDISDLQSNANIYVPILFARAEASSTYGTLTNVVIDVQNATMSTTASTHYPSLGKWFTAENVAVYGFDTSWIQSDGTRGNVYTGTDNVNGDGSAAGIYVEYADDTTNGATFWQSVLSNDIWKIVDGVPYLKNVEVTGTVTDPSDSIVEGSAEYNFAWSDSVAGSYDAIQFINDTTTKATNTTLGVTTPNLSDFSTKQVIVGSYETYAKYISNGPTEYDGTNYGVYVNGNTIFVLAENEEAFIFAAQEFCRQMYGWRQLTYLQCDADAIVLDSSKTTIDSSNITNYTTKVTFEKREPANGLSGTYDRTDLGFNGQSPFSYYGVMHNSLDYFDVHGSSDSAKFTDKAATWDSTTYPNATIANAYNTGSASSATQLCYLGHGDKNTFDAMVAHVVTIITAQKASAPKMTAINLMLEDNTDYCTCTACGKFSNPSVTQTIFLNAVANQLAANGVDVDVEFFSYNAYSPAPILSSTELESLASLASDLGITYETTTVDYSDLSYASKLSSTSATVLKCADGLRLWWTSHEANHSFALEHEANAHMYMALQAWIASIGTGKTDVFMYETTYRDYFTPLNTWEYQILWYQSLNKLGVNTHMFNLGDVHNAPDKQTGFAAFKTYIDSRAMTDMNVTFDELKDEFFAEDGYYGKGGPIMRTFFEELVEVYESHKQGGTADFVSTSEFGSSTDVTNGQVNTLWQQGEGYIASWILQKNYYDRTDFPNYYAQHRQAFFNGSYGRDLTAMVFGGRASSKTPTTSTDVYVHSNYTSQQKTLEAWYTYCMTALGEVDAGSKYETRIKIEALFPEYQYLVYQSTYSTTTSETSPTVTSTQPTTGSDVFTDNYSATAGQWYQNLYEDCVTLGMLKPAEFYHFTAAGDTSCVAEVSAFAGLTYNYYYMYENMWKNWGITAVSE